MKTTITKNDFYCNQKFWWLTVDLEKIQTASCCAAMPNKINLSWMKQNPGKIFNTPVLLEERRQMLDNQPVASCDTNCWRAENAGLSSRRLVQQGNKKTHLKIESNPETLNIIVGSDCNLTCVYCCKNYSTAWYRDIEQHGAYAVSSKDDRFAINSRDKLLQLISQKDLSQSSTRLDIIQELNTLYQSKALKEVFISGGEPFLYLDLVQLVQTLPKSVIITIWTGLGVDPKRFRRELSCLPAHTQLVVSAENIESAYEFVRYGNTWQRFCDNLQILEESGLDYKFNATVSNLTLPGLKKFISWSNRPVMFSPCLDPDFLSVSVLDNNTKQLLLSDIEYMPDFAFEALEVNPDPSQVYNFKTYIKEFAKRRSLTLTVFPDSMRQWIES